MPYRTAFIASFTVAAALAVGASPAHAALAVGAAAPDFSTQSALGGKPAPFKLADALKQGPVVLYFFPKAFTEGCTVEAHDFAEATARFNALGATVVGVSNDNIETLQRFSVEACRNKFAVAADPDSKIIAAYDAKLAFVPGGVADRISYVIAPSGKVAYVYSSLNPDQHVANTMAAVEKLTGAKAPAAETK